MNLLVVLLHKELPFKLIYYYRHVFLIQLSMKRCVIYRLSIFMGALLIFLLGNSTIELSFPRGMIMHAVCTISILIGLFSRFF
jgi:hypothetical protein